MKFLEFTVTTTHEGSELVADALWEYSDSGVAVSDVYDVIQLAKEGKTWDYADDELFSASSAVLVKAYFPMENASETVKDAEAKLLRLKENSPLDLGSLETAKREIDGELWREQWKEHFKPIHIGKVVVVPEWIDYKQKAGEIIVKIDSNMAFGTGEHETTSMCVTLLEKYVKKSDVVLDVGCGSGILGITAEKLGAARVVMTDIDAEAVAATRRNMKSNGTVNASVTEKNLLDDAKVKGDVIVCNIMAEVLISFAPKITNNVFAGGTVILSGILTERLPAVRKAYEEAGFDFVEDRKKGEWTALVMKRRAQ